MGISPYYNKFRASVAFDGEQTQVYFDTREQAEEYIANVEAINKSNRPPWAAKTKKRETAKHQDLPVGWYEHESKRHLPSGTISISKVITCSFKLNGNQTWIRVGYGKKRSRSEAIVLLTRKVLKRLEDQL